MRPPPWRFYFCCVAVVYVVVSIFLLREELASWWFQIKRLPCRNASRDARRVLVLQIVWGANVKETWQQQTELVNRAYAARWQYDYALVTASLDGISVPSIWLKVFTLRDRLSAYDYVFYLDSDAFVMNFDRTLDSLIDLDPQADLIMGGYWHGFDRTGERRMTTHTCRFRDSSLVPFCGVNAGVLLLRNSTWSQQMLNHWASLADDTWGPLFEQAALQHMLWDDWNDFGAHVCLVPPGEINTGDTERDLARSLGWAAGIKETCAFVVHLWNSGVSRSKFMHDIFVLGEFPEWLINTCPMVMPQSVLEKVRRLALGEPLDDEAFIAE